MSMTKKVTKWQMVVDGDASGAMRALDKVGHTARKLAATIGVAFAAKKVLDFGKAAVNAMLEDQKSAALLAKTLQNVTHARTQDIAAIEDYIKKTTLATGVADDQLRPAFSRLVRSTKNTTKAQTLLNLSLDISAATGKDLETVANSVSKAYDGNFTALRKLGLSVDQNLIKSKDFAKVQAYLQKVFGGSMATATQTLAGRMQILKNAFAEMKEDVGYALLPTLEKFAAWMAGPGLKAISAFFSALSGKGMGGAARDPNSRVADWEEKADPLTESAAKLGDALRNLVKAIGDLFSAFDSKKESGLVGFINLLTTLLNLLTSILTIIGKVTKAVGGASSKQSGGQGWWNDLLYWVNQHGPNKAKSREDWWNGQQRAIGGTVNPGTSYLVGERGPELFSPTSSGFITPNGALAGGAGGAVNVTVNVHGSVIRERDLAVSVRDTMAQLMRRRGLDPSILGV